LRPAAFARLEQATKLGPEVGSLDSVVVLVYSIKRSSVDPEELRKALNEAFPQLGAHCVGALRPGVYVATDVLSIPDVRYRFVDKAGRTVPLTRDTLDKYFLFDRAFRPEIRNGVAIGTRPIVIAVRDTKPFIDGGPGEDSLFAVLTRYCTYTTKCSKY